MQVFSVAGLPLWLAEALLLKIVVGDDEQFFFVIRTICFF